MLLAGALSVAGLVLGVACSSGGESEGEREATCRSGPARSSTSAGVDAGCFERSPTAACRDDACRPAVLTGCVGATAALASVVPPRCDDDSTCCGGSTCTELVLNECCGYPDDVVRVKVCWP